MAHRYLSTMLGLGGTWLAATVADVNWGAVAGGITGVGLAFSGAWWSIASARNKAYQENEAAKIQAFRENEAAKLEAFQANERAKLQMQRESDDVNRGSISVAMERLNRNLEEANAKADANERLARTAAEQAARLQEMHQECISRCDGQSELIGNQAKTIAQLTNNVTEIKTTLDTTLDRTARRVEDLNTKLHDERRNAEGYVETIRVLTAELDEYKSRLGPVIEGVAANREKIIEVDVKHADAINTNATSIETIASHMEPPIEVSTTRVEPADGPTGQGGR